MVALISNPELREGTYFPDSDVVVPLMASEAIPMWSPVILAAAVGTEICRIATTATANDKLVIGVAVGPLRTDGSAAIAAGQFVKVCVRGFCKVKVDGTDPIAIGDALVTKAAAGVAVLADIVAGEAEAEVMAVFAKALLDADEDGDVIPCYVNIHGGTET